MARSVIQDGFAVSQPLIEGATLHELTDAATQVQQSAKRAGAGIRAVLRLSPHLAEFARSDVVRDLVLPLLGGKAFVVRSILFDKTPEANWDVVWHQDTTIAVQERHDVSGFGPWSIKAGTPHVQPPAIVLENMLTVRVHLDACREDNGPLLVVPGSHQSGILRDAAINAAECEAGCEACIVEQGGVVMMRPLLLHASKKSLSPSHRRVLHLEFASLPLPPPLAWVAERADETGLALNGGARPVSG